MAKKTEELVKKGNEAIEPLPDWVNEEDAGQEGGSNEDLVLPRLSICQSTSPQRKKGDPAFIPDLEEGDLFNNVTKEIYSRPLRVTPLILRHMKIYYGEKMGDPIRCFGRPKGEGEIACDLNNGGPCKHPGFGKGFCSLIMNFPLILHSDAATPIVVSLKSASINVGKTWYTLLRLRRANGKPVPWYAQQFDLDTVFTKFKEGDAYVLTVEAVPGFTPVGVGKFAQAATRDLLEAEKRGQTIRAHEEQPQEREPGEEM